MFTVQPGRLPEHLYTIVHWRRPTEQRWWCRTKQVHVPPCVRFCSTFISLLAHWATLPILTGCTSWIFPAPYSTDVAVVFHPLIRMQNATCCVHQRENRAPKTVQQWSSLGRGKKCHICGSGLIYFLLPILRNNYDYRIVYIWIKM